MTHDPRRLALTIVAIVAAASCYIGATLHAFIQGVL